MAKLFLIFFTVFLMVFAISGQQDNEVIGTYSGVPIYKLERHCALVEGLCVHKSDCSVETTKTGLCPSNQHLGVECCYELRQNHRPCPKRLAECMPWCGDAVRMKSAHCEGGHYCCILV